jgi:hypothetical protein
VISQECYTLLEGAQTGEEATLDPKQSLHEEEQQQGEAAAYLAHHLCMWLRSWDITNASHSQLEGAQPTAASSATSNETRECSMYVLYRYHIKVTMFTKTQSLLMALALLLIQLLNAAITKPMVF